MIQREVLTALHIHQLRISCAFQNLGRHLRPDTRLAATVNLYFAGQDLLRHRQKFGVGRQPSAGIGKGHRHIDGAFRMALHKLHFGPNI